MCSCWNSPTTKDAFRLSIASLLIEFLAACFGISLFMDSGSSLVLVYGLENVVDLLSTCVVLWRFFAPTTLDDALERKLKQREDRASVGISFIMVSLGLTILITSVADFARGPEDIFQEEFVMITSFFSIIFFGALAVLKFRYATKLESPSMRKDGQCALIGAWLGCVMFVNAFILLRNPDAWWIDPLVSFAAGLVAIYLGAQALKDAYTVEGLPIFTTSWWFDSTSDSSLKSTTATDGDLAMDTTSTRVEEGDIV